MPGIITTAIVNLEFKLGESWFIDVTCRDSNDAVIDLSAAAIRWRLSLNNAVALDLALSSGITLVNAVGGECLITVTPLMQAALVAGAYKHQLRLILSDGSVSDQFSGAFKINPSLF